MKKLDKLSKIIFFGAIWGLIEATIGYALHLLPALVAGSIMFPIVVFILYHAYKSLGSRKAIFFVGLIAIMIKATNLFLPFLFPAKTINPMIAMVIQTLLVFAIIPLLDSKKLGVKVASIVMISVAWRLVMVGYYGVNYLITDFLDFRLKGFEPAFTYIVTEGIISGAFAVGLIFATNPIKALVKFDRSKINPIISTAVLVIAIVLTLVKF